MESISRKDFFRKMGLVAGTAIVMPLNSVFASFNNDVELSDEKKQFLSEYQQWLLDFHQFVEKRNRNPLDIENNKHLMELSAQADKRKPTLEKNMKDSRFADYFNKITNEITESIEG
ncbi:MAG: hypothetical protein WCX31_09685 [Salinivirgaceae bacterium]|jgi:hypothetical protein